MPDGPALPAAPATKRSGFDPQRFARALRRATAIAAIATFTWFFVRFGTRWVPVGIDAVPSLPPNAWCIVDRWASGLRVGSDVFYDGPLGLMVGRVSALHPDAARPETFGVRNVNEHSRLPDSATFGALPISALHGTVLTSLGGDGRGW